MATPTRTRTPIVKTPAPPRTAADNKRTFDMRPKPSDDTRRHEEPRYRAPQHPDAGLDQPLDGSED